jgi:tRNA nucleotidyltransferase/poly(A) polymerase
MRHVEPKGTALKSGEKDVITDMYYSKERHKLVDFSVPYAAIKHSIFVRKTSIISDCPSLYGFPARRSDVELDALLAPHTLLGRVARWLREEGVEAYLVGGSVRDALLGRAAGSFHDLDFAVPAGGLVLARRLANRLGGAFFPLDAGRDTGRAVLTEPDGSRFYLDFARWRGDSLEADLADRDFTINAMALDVIQREGETLIDPFGGQADLAAGVVRAVTDRSFADDPARTLRAVRMAAVLGFRIEPHTQALLRQAIPELDGVSRERVRDELDRILAAPGAADHARRLHDLGLLAAVLPEVAALKGVTQSPPHRVDVYEHTLQVLAAFEGLFAWLWPGGGCAPLTGDAALAAAYLSPWRDSLRSHLLQPTSGDRVRATLLKLTALLHDVGKPETRSQDETGRVRFLGHEQKGGAIAARALRRLRFSSQEMALVQTVVAHHLRPLQLSRTEAITRRAVYRFFRDAGAAGVDVILLALADHLGTHGDALEPRGWGRALDAAAVLLEGYFSRHQEVISPPKLVGGRDLIVEFGLSPGPRVGELLERVREAQAEGQVFTREDALSLLRESLEGGR